MAYRRKAEDYLERGQFQRAVQVYDESGDEAKCQIASLACAQDCLEIGLYERAIGYFEQGNRADIADKLRQVLKNSDIRINIQHLDNLGLFRTNSCGREKYFEFHNLESCFVGKSKDDFLNIVKYVQEQDFIGKAKGLKNGKQTNSKT